MKCPRYPLRDFEKQSDYWSKETQEPGVKLETTDLCSGVLARPSIGALLPVGRGDSDICSVLSEAEVVFELSATVFTIGAVDSSVVFARESSVDMPSRPGLGSGFGAAFKDDFDDGECTRGNLTEWSDSAPCSVRGSRSEALTLVLVKKCMPKLPFCLSD